jgi:hypothetical protein
MPNRLVILLERYQVVSSSTSLVSILIELLFATPGPSTFVELIVSMIFDLWTDEKSQLSLDTGNYDQLQGQNLLFLYRILRNI